MGLNGCNHFNVHHPSEGVMTLPRELLGEILTYLPLEDKQGQQ